MSEVKVQKEELKEDLSRMEGAYGAAMIGKIKQMRVYISGLKGLGIETAKNLLLAGPKAVTIRDDEPVALADLGTNFYLSTSDVGRGRGEAVLAALKDLNPRVDVELAHGDPTPDFLRTFDVVVFTDRTPLKRLVEFNEACRSRTKKDETGKEVAAPVVFLYGSMEGVSASIFADFGPHHHIFDADGSPEKTLIIDDITNEKNGLVLIDGDRHLLSTGDVIKMEDVKGMGEKVAGEEGKIYQLDDEVKDINSMFVVREHKSNPKMFFIGDTTKLGKYISGGIATTVKVGQDLSYESLAKQLNEPRFMDGYIDFTKFGREMQLHFARLALWRFLEEKGALPALHSQEDADALVALAKDQLEQNKKAAAAGGAVLVTDEIDEAVVRNVALYARAEQTALAALMGGVLAQEITKQTGKYTPINQWFHFDAFELLDDKVPADATPIGSRYDHNIALFGKAFQDKVQRQRVFMIGCGALGCEYMKALALNGFGVSGGEVHITDDDRIELSNLSRQFLFRHKHVNKPKSTSAAQAALVMNPEMAGCLKSHEIRVEPRTEDHFDDKFWTSLDLVLNALDNNEARKYSDSQCVFHHKPLFESGTLGTQANSVICLPFKTPSYSEGAVAGENQGIAQCTIRNFPYLDLHCIEWSREMFNEMFTHGPDALNALLEDKAGFYKKLENQLEERATLELAVRWLDLARAPSFDTCLRIAFDYFHKFFRDAIRDLTHLFPEDARVKDPNNQELDLGPFWHGHKRFPRATEFDAANEMHLDYVYATANILASIFNVPELRDREEMRRRVAALEVSPWAYKGATVKLDEDKKDESKAEVVLSAEDKDAIAAIKKHIETVDIKAVGKLNSADFEKDDDTNHHIDFITASTNLRCFNYHIKPTTRANCRMVAGRIIPAIATTTAMITGFVMIEVMKYIKGADLSAYRAATCNLGTNVYCVELLPDPIKKKTGLDPESYMQCTAIPEGYTSWDKVVIDAPGVTLKEFLEEFKRVHHNATITTLVAPNGRMLFNDFSDAKQLEQDMKTVLIDLYTKKVGEVFPASRNYVVLIAAGLEDEEGNTAICPKIQYIFRH